MPITTHESEADTYRDDDHWSHVMETFFVEAIRRAEFEVVRPTAVGADLIHAQIIEQLINADLVLVDLSSHNPNVFFELGVRTAANKPISLVVDGLTALPFDTGGINTHEYDHEFKYWNLEPEIKKLSEHIRASYERSRTENPLWKKFGVDLVASTPASDENSTEAKMDMLLNLFQSSIASGQAFESNLSATKLSTGFPQFATDAVWSRDQRRNADLEKSLPGEHPADAFARASRRHHMYPPMHVEVLGPNIVEVVWDSTPGLEAIESMRTLAERQNVELLTPQVSSKMSRAARNKAMHERSATISDYIRAVGPQVSDDQA